MSEGWETIHVKDGCIEVMRIPVEKGADYVAGLLERLAQEGVFDEPQTTGEGNLLLPKDLMPKPSPEERAEINQRRNEYLKSLGFPHIFPTGNY